MFLFSSFNFNFCSAQIDQEISDQTSFGGKLKCKVSGKAPYKNLLSVSNAFSIVEGGGLTQVTFVSDSEEVSGDITNESKFIVLIPVFSTDEFFSNERIKLDSDNSEVNLKQIKKSVSIATEVSNQDLFGNRTNTRGRIKITSFNDSVASGLLRLSFNISKLTQTKEEEIIKDVDNNGSVVLKCTFENVPYEVSQLAE